MCAPARVTCGCAARCRCRPTRRRTCLAGRAPGDRLEVQCVEVEPLGLDLGAFGHTPAHRDEHVDDAVGQCRHRVPRTRGAPIPRQRDVDCFFDQEPGVALQQQLRLTFGQRRRHCGTGLAHPASGICFGLRWQGPDLAVRERERRAVTCMGDAKLAQLLEVGRRGDRGSVRRRVPARLRQRAAGSPRQGRSRCSGRT